MGGIRRAFLRTRSSSMSRIREEMICGGVAAGNRQLVSIPTGSFPSSAETVCLSENGCTSWSRQGDTRRNYLMRHGDASSRASVTITKALELLCLSPCFGRSHLLAEKSIYMYTYIYNFGI